MLRMLSSLAIVALTLGLVLLTDAVHAMTNNNFTVFTPQVDMALRQAPDSLWDTFAGLGVAFGIIFAFVGSRMLRTAAFFFGACAGALLASVILAAIGNVQSQIWLPVVGTTAVICGLIVSCVVSMARFVTILVLGVAIAGVFVQYGLSYIPDLPSWVLYVMIGFFVLLCAFLAYKSYKFMMIFATSFVGGFVVLLSVARLTRGPISLAGMWVEPEFLAACVDMSCWGPFIAGGSVCVLGLLYQLRRFRGKTSSGKKRDKKTKRELAAAERARKQEKERFEERVREIREIADAEIAQATMASRQALDSAQREREGLLQQTRALEEERERLRQSRLRVDQETRVVEAEYVHYSGNVAELPIATPAAASSSTRGSKKQPQRNLAERPPRPQRPASRPPPPTPDGWGGGARPWNKCAEHQVPYETCGCTNPRSKEQVLAELERLKQEREQHERDQKELELRNAELRERLRKAEITARQVTQQAALVQKKAAEDALKTSQVEEKLNHERAELERLLKEAEEERQQVSLQLESLQKARRLDQQQQQAQNQARVVSTNDENSAAAPPGPTPSDLLEEKLEEPHPSESSSALDEEELRLKERVAQVEGLELSLRREMEVLQKQPVRVFTEPNLAALIEKEAEEQENKAEMVAPPSVSGSPGLGLKKMSLHLMPSVPLRLGGSSSAANLDSSSRSSASPQQTTAASPSKFASKWSNVERTYGVAGASASVQEMPVKGGNEGSRTAKVGEEEDEGELKPVGDLMSDLSSLLGKIFQFTLEAIVFVIATTGWAIGKCLDTARDAHMEHQEKQLRANSAKRSQFRASDVKDRFSSPVKIEQQPEDV